MGKPACHPRQLENIKVVCFLQHSIIASKLFARDIIKRFAGTNFYNKTYLM